MDDLAELTKQALRRLAKSVAVITATWDDRNFAMAATAVEGLSLEPPSLLICVAKTASLAAPLAAGASFAVNLLGDDQAAISARCGAPWQGDDRFVLGSWDYDGPAPILDEAQASFFCTPDGGMTYGSHAIVVGRIIAVRVGGSVAPLVYADGRYGSVAALG